MRRSIPYFAVPIGWFLGGCLAYSLVHGACSAGERGSDRARGATDFARAVISIAEDLQGQKLIYSSRPEDLRDCSGIFHRVLERLRQRCRAITGPEHRSVRSSRAIAAWYAEHGNLVVIKDALDQDHLITPGAVMFYGRRNQRYSRISRKKALEDVEHVGMVTSVERDGAGNVVSYRLFHGRSDRKPAAITDYHTRLPTRAHYPPLGNGAQPWIAVAEVCSRACVCEDSRSG
ncbi:MAG: hypothetical protein GY856_05405 [bacterium]|nr:hypothetical protein [bacterium]